MEVANGTQALVDGLGEKGHRRSLDELVTENTVAACERRNYIVSVR